jgi:hypothetical protein
MQTMTSHPLTFGNKTHTCPFFNMEKNTPSFTFQKYSYPQYFLPPTSYWCLWHESSFTHCNFQIQILYLHKVPLHSFIALVQCIFSFLKSNHTISQSFIYMRLIHCKIKVHIHEFYKCDENYYQNCKIHWLECIHVFDFFCILES